MLRNFTQTLDMNAHKRDYEENAVCYLWVRGGNLNFILF